MPALTSVLPQSLRDLTSQMIIGNANVPFVVIMGPNPQVFRSNSRKSYSETQTLGAFVFEHWGNRPDQLQCTGWTPRKVGTALQFAQVDLIMLQMLQIFKLDKERIASFLKAFRGSPNVPSGTTVTNFFSNG